MRFLILAFSVLSVSAFAAEAGEQLTMPQFPAGWTKVFSGHGKDAREGQEQVEEYAPVGQSSQKFQDKIVIETYHRLNLPLDVLQRRAVAQAHDGCNGVIEGKFQSGVNNGYASAYWTLGCKNLKRTSFGETRYTKAIQSGDTLYLITRLWRTKGYDDKGPSITAQSLREGYDFLTTTIICQEGSQQHPCGGAKPR